MPTLTVSTGWDTHVRESSPTQSFPNSRFPLLRSGDEAFIYLLLSFNATRIAGKEILSAPLSIPVDENWISQTVTIQATEEWKVAQVSYDDMPALVGPTANSGATGALSPGDRFTIDIKDLIQEIADGEPNHGWRLSTSQSTELSRVRGFESGFDSSWTLDIEYIDRPDAPTQVTPEGIIGIGAWTVGVEHYDQLAEMQVQVDATPSGTNPDYDTGWVPTTRPKIDLTDTFPLGESAGVPDTSFGSLANNATTYQRVRVKLLNGGESDWSAWFEVTRVNKPTMTMISPSGTDIWDPTTNIKASLTPAGDANTRWQVVITDVGDPSNERYNSGSAVTGIELDHPIPLRWKNQDVMPDDGTYRLEVRAWDRSDREGSPGDLPYVRTLVDVTLDVDGAENPPTNLTATATPTDPLVYPTVVLAWERAADPHWFLVRRDQKFLALVDVDDFRTSPGHWEWEDTTADPNGDHIYTVRAVTVISGENRMSASSNSAVGFAGVEGVWLRSEFGDVLIDGDGIGDWRQVPKQVEFVMPYRDDDVVVTTAAGGWRGSFEGVIDAFQDRDVDADRAILEDLRTHPNVPVRLVAATLNIPVKLRNLTVPPHSSIMPETDRTHTVSFTFSERPPPAGA